MLVICSSTKPNKLGPFLAPLLSHCGVETVVVTPEQLSAVSFTTPGDVLLLMGKQAFEFLVTDGVVSKKQKLGSARETLLQWAGIPCLVTFDLNLCDFMPEVRPDIEWDIQLAIRYALNGHLDPAIGEYKYVEDFSEVLSWAHACDHDALTPMTVDTETLGLDEFDPHGRLLTIQLTYELAYSLVYRLPEEGSMSELVRSQLELLFTLPWINTVGANLKYDRRWLWKRLGLEIKNHRFDTQLVGSLVNENRYNSLKAHCKAYAPELGGYETKFEEQWKKDRMDLALAGDPAGFLTYAGGDTDAALRIYHPLRKQLLEDPILARFYTRLLHPASIVFQKLESRGLLIDKERYLQLQSEATIEAAQQEKECLGMMSNHIKYKYADNLKLSRDVIVRDFLFGPQGLSLKPLMFTEKEQKPSTAWDHLKLFIDHPEAGPFVEKLKEYNATSKALSTYIIGFLKHLRSDGYFHPSYILAKGGQAGDEDDGGGTNSGRSSCKDPAYQTWPKRTAWSKRLRSVVIPPPGYILAKIDMSQGELRIMADASNCKAMIQAYLNGWDLHALTAAGFLNMTLAQFLTLPEEEIEKHRYGAKAGNFGLIYRISPTGYMAFADTSYGVKLTLAQAEKNHGAFFDTYPEIHTYHDNQVRLARKHGFVRNQLGRVRHTPLIHSYDSETRGKAERQAINAPTQGCLFDMMMLLMVQIDRVRPDIWMFGNTHDSLEFYLKEDIWEADLLQIKYLAENLPLNQFDWTPKVPFVVDGEIGTKHLGDMKKVKIKV